MKIFASIAGIIGAALLTLTLSIDGIVKNGIEDSASELLETEVKISDVDISIFSGKGEIEGFAILNPDGFSNKEAIRFKKMSMKVNLTSLLSETVVVEELIVQSPEVYLEQSGAKANLKELSNNIEADSGEEDTSKKMVINYFLMEEGVVSVSSEVEDLDGVEVTISRVELTEVGKESSNTIRQTMKQILEPVIKDVVAETVEGQIINKVENTVKDLIGN